MFLSLWLKNITNLYTQGQTWLSTSRAFPSVIMEANRSIPLNGHLTDRKAKGSGIKVEMHFACMLQHVDPRHSQSPQTYVCSDEEQWWGWQERRPDRNRGRVMECCRTRGWWESGGYVGVIPKTRKLYLSLSAASKAALHWDSNISWESVICSE